jgi:NAD(P)-dependent dehydrogenase (short-subunit alcohol dehydrogenase family)
MTQTIFITGASTGLGRAAAALFAARGWKVFATMRNPDAAGDVAQTPGVTVLKLDVRRPDQIAEAARNALSRGPVDVLFNNAGYGLAGAFEGASDDQLVDEIDTNLLGVMRVTQAFLPAMRERRQGVILATTSIGGLVTFPFNSVYHATKWGLEGWSESLAYELAPFGIRVRTIAPGGIATDFAGRSLVRTTHPAYAEPMEKVIAAFSNPERRARASSAEQIAEAAYEAATDTSDRVTFVAGEDAKTLYAQRLQAGVDPFRAAVRAQFLGA